MVKIHGKDYMEVKERVKYLREKYPDYSIETDIKKLDQNCVIQATIKNADGRIVSQGIAHEVEGSSMINSTSHVENCETSAIGRALGFFGIGIDGSIASADEVNNAISRLDGAMGVPMLDDIIIQIDQAIRRGKVPPADLIKYNEMRDSMTVDQAIATLRHFEQYKGGK